MKDLSIKTWCLLHFLQASIGFFHWSKLVLVITTICTGWEGTWVSPPKKKSLKVSLAVSTKSLDAVDKQECPQSTVRRQRTQVRATAQRRCGVASYCCHPAGQLCRGETQETVVWRKAGNCYVEKRRTRHRCTGDTVTCRYLDADISELTTTNNNHRWLQTISYGHHRRSPFFILVSDLYNVSMEQVTVWNYHCPPGNGTEPKSSVPIGLVFAWLKVANYMGRNFWFEKQLRPFKLVKSIIIIWVGIPPRKFVITTQTNHEVTDGWFHN